MHAGISGRAARRTACRAREMPSAMRRRSPHEREAASDGRRGLGFAREIESAGRRSAPHVREMPFDGRRTPFHGGKTLWYVRRGRLHALNLGFRACRAQLYGDEASGTPQNPAGEFANAKMRMIRRGWAGETCGGATTREFARRHMGGGIHEIPQRAPARGPELRVAIEDRALPAASGSGSRA